MKGLLISQIGLLLLVCVAPGLSRRAGQNPAAKDYLVTLDFPGHQLRLARGELPNSDGKAIIRYTLDRGVPVIPIRIGRITTRGSLDSGAMGGIMVPLKLAGKLALRSSPQVVGKMKTLFNEFTLLQARLDGKVQIGSDAIDNPMLTFADIFDRTNIGRDVLHRFAITFDQSNRRVRFLRTGDK